MPFAPAVSTAVSSGRRWWRVGQNAGASFVAKIVSGACALVMVPLLLTQLGVEMFGWVSALVALVSLSQFADLGVAMALQSALSAAHARESDGALRTVYASGTRLLAGLGGAWLAISAPLAWWLGAHAFPAPGGLDAITQKSAWLALVIATAVGVPLSAGPRLAAALQLSWVHAMWTAAVNLAGVVAVLLAVRAGAGVVVFLVLLCVVQVMPGLLTSLHLSRRLGWNSKAAPERAEMRRLWHSGLPFAGANLAGALLISATPLAFARFGGYGASAAFAILQRLFGLLTQAHAMLLTPLWPAYAEAAAQDDRAWVLRTFRVSLGLTLLAAAAVAALTAVLPWIVPRWLGVATPVPTAHFAWLLAGWTVATAGVQACTFFLLGLHRLQSVAMRVALAHLLTLAAMAVGGKIFGGLGVAVALALGTILGPLWLLAHGSASAWRELERKNSTAPATAASV